MGIDTSKGVLRIQDRCHGNSTAKDANPCDLAQTRAWVEDYKRWVAGLPAVGDQAQPPDLQEAVSLDHNRHDRSLLVHAIRYYPALAVDRQGSVTAAIGPSPRIQAQSAWAMASLLGASSPLGARACGATGMQIDSATRFRGGGRYENFRMVDGRGGARPEFC